MLLCCLKHIFCCAMLGHILSGGDDKQYTSGYYCRGIFSAMLVVNKLLYFYLYYVLCTGGLAAMMCERFVIISYVTNNYVDCMGNSF